MQRRFAHAVVERAASISLPAVCDRFDRQRANDRREAADVIAVVSIQYRSRWGNFDPARRYFSTHVNGRFDGVSDERALRELYALQYPAAALAAIAYGTRYRYQPSDALALDWAAILVALNGAGFVKAGPAIGRASFWYVTDLFQRDMRAATTLLARVVGNGWAEAVIHRVIRHAVGGPVHANASVRARVRGSSAPQARTTRAVAALGFRLLDEPAPWRTALEARRAITVRRTVRGSVPDVWRDVPWRVPADLQDRGARPLHTGRMGETESATVALLRAAIQVADEQARDGNASVESLDSALAALTASAKLARGTDGYTMDLDLAAKSALERLQGERTRVAMRFFERRADDERPI